MDLDQLKLEWLEAETYLTPEIRLRVDSYGTTAVKLAVRSHDRLGALLASEEFPR